MYAVYKGKIVHDNVISMMKELYIKILKILENGDDKFNGLSFRKIGEIIGVKHPQSVIYHLQRLESLGFMQIDWKRKIFKGIRSQDRKSSGIISIPIPILGSADCGEATKYADEQLEGYIRISKSLLHGISIKNLFAVKASGDSMNKAIIEKENIEDGDYVVVSKGATNIKNGDYVLSIIDDKANIKRFFKDKTGNIVLTSESSREYPPIYITEEDSSYIVNGKVIKVIKNKR